MKKKQFSSYAEIESELEILKLEKEINYKKLVLNVQRTKESLSPHNIITNSIRSISEEFSFSYSKIIQNAIPYIIGWFLNKKRG